MKHEDSKQTDTRRGYLLLWGGVLAGPIAWLIQFQIRYSLVLWVCATHHQFVLHLVSLLFLLVIASGGFMCWQSWQRSGKDWPSDSQATPQMRNQFLSLLGMMTCSLFGLLTLAQAIPAFLLNPCQQ